MILVLITDTAGGISFHGKRQSRDRELTREILRLSRGRVLIVDTYSAGLFGEHAPERMRVADHPAEGAGEGDFVFLERMPEAGALRESMGLAEKIYLFRWDKRYPADAWLPPGFPGPGWKKAGEKRFAGFSHEKITEEVWMRGKEA